MIWHGTRVTRSHLNTTLTAADGHSLTAHRADPPGAPRGGIVVIQEIFGVNSHIRRVTDGFAAPGYAAIAPAIFDRVERGFEVGYDPAAIARGRELVGRLDGDKLLLDVQAAIATVAPAGRVGTVGYCYGGAVVWVAAARADGLACAVSYYGSRIPQFVDLAPRIPVMMHVGRRDGSFPAVAVAQIAERHPAVVIHEYDAGHGFNCDERADHDPAAAALAFDRTVAFFRDHVG